MDCSGQKESGNIIHNPQWEHCCILALVRTMLEPPRSLELCDSPLGRERWSVWDTYLSVPWINDSVPNGPPQKITTRTTLNSLLPTVAARSLHPVKQQQSSMSRFWAAGGSSSSDDDSERDSDSDSSGSGSENEDLGGGGGGLGQTGQQEANRWLAMSDDSSDEDSVRVVLSGKERFQESVTTSISALRKAMKSRDYYEIQVQFDVLSKALIKNKQYLVNGVPRPLVRILVDLEDYAAIPNAVGATRTGLESHETHLQKAQSRLSNRHGRLSSQPRRFRRRRR
jgi:Eukaryotic translation initiation factor 3 subunit 8 N-terminus